MSSLNQRWLERRASRRRAKEAARQIATARLRDLVVATISDEARAALTQGQAALCEHEDLLDGPAVELDPVRPNAAGLVVYVEYDRLVHCEIAGRYGHEIFSSDQAEIAAEVRSLVRALLDGTYKEMQRDRRHSSTVRAEWPGGHSSRIDSTQDAGGEQTEWRLRAYDPY